MVKGLLKSGFSRIGAEINAYLIPIKDFSSSRPHSNLIFLPNKFVKGDTSSAKLEINRQYHPATPNSLLTSLTFLGVVKFIMNGTLFVNNETQVF